MSCSSARACCLRCRRPRRWQAITDRHPVDPVHDVERRPENGAVVAGKDRPGDRNGLILDGVENAELAKHVVRGLRARVPRRAAQHPALAPAHHREDLARAAAAHRLDGDLLPCHRAACPESPSAAGCFLRFLCRCQSCHARLRRDVADLPSVSMTKSGTGSGLPPLPSATSHAVCIPAAAGPSMSCTVESPTKSTCSAKITALPKAWR